MAMSIVRETTIPEQKELRNKSCIYMLKQPAASEFDIYVTDGEGNLFTHFNEDRFRRLFNENAQTLHVMFSVTTIEARDLLPLAQDSLVYVADATGDGDITHGFGFYFYTHATQSFHLLVKEDVPPPRWEDLQGRPQSTVAQIDDAVARAHSHANADVLNELTDVGGQLHYNEAPVSTVHFLGGEWA